MAGASIRYALDDAAAQATLQALLDRGADLTPAMDAIGGIVVQSTRRRFETNVGPDDTPWLPSQRALAQGGQTLRDTGELRRSITHDAGPDFVEIGTNLVYAGIHQFGGKTGRGHAVELPARPFLGIGDEDEETILDEMTVFLGGAL